MAIKATQKDKPIKKVKSNTLKINDTTIVRDPISTRSPWIEDYQDFFTLRQKPVSEAFLERLAQELINYSKTTQDILRHEWFFTEKGIPPKTARAWAQKYPAFGLAYNTAKYIIGMRRENGSLRKHFDAATYFKSAQRYDEECVEDAKFHAGLRIEALSDAEGRQVIVLPRIVDERLET